VEDLVSTSRAVDHLDHEGDPAEHRCEDVAVTVSILGDDLDAEVVAHPEEDVIVRTDRGMGNRLIHETETGTHEVPRSMIQHIISGDELTSGVGWRHVEDETAGAQQRITHQPPNRAVVRPSDDQNEALLRIV